MAETLATQLVAVRTGVSATDWRAAIRAAGDDLVAHGVTTAAYTDEMIEAIERLGPYVVVAPGVALAHSRPSPAVLRTGLCWVGLATPVAFGHPKNDPVRVVVGLAATDHDGHLAAMSAIAVALATTGRREALLAEQDADEVRRLLGAENPPEPQAGLEEQGRQA